LNNIDLVICYNDLFWILFGLLVIFFILWFLFEEIFETQKDDFDFNLKTTAKKKMLNWAMLVWKFERLLKW
jgi:hypothetical protein